MLTGNQMACVFSGPLSSVDPAFIIAQRKIKEYVNDSSFHSINQGFFLKHMRYHLLFSDVWSTLASIEYEIYV